MDVEKIKSIFNDVYRGAAETSGNPTIPEYQTAFLAAILSDILDELKLLNAAISKKTFKPESDSDSGKGVSAINVPPVKNEKQKILPPKLVPKKIDGAYLTAITKGETLSRKKIEEILQSENCPIPLDGLIEMKLIKKMGAHLFRVNDAVS